MSKKTMIIVVSICAGILTAILIAGVIFALQTRPDTGVGEGTKWGGLFSTEQLGKLPTISTVKREEEYLARPDVPMEIETQFDKVVSDRLSIGDFEYLDDYLYNVYKNYKDGADDADLHTLSAQYRADINTYKTLTEENAKTSFSGFRCPDTLAAAVVYAPLSAKYDAFVNRSSLAMPPPIDLNSVNLRPAEMDEADLAAKLDVINAPREMTFQSLCAFDMELYGLEFRLFIVQTRDGYYQPYQLTTVGGYDLLIPTADVTFIRDFRSTLPNAAALDSGISHSKMDAAAFEKHISEQLAQPLPEPSEPLEDSAVDPDIPPA